MNCEELQQAINETLEEIEQVKFQIEKAIEPKQKRKLRQQLKELQNLQLWHLGQQDIITKART